MGTDGRGWVLSGAVLVGAVASVLFLKPVLLAPVAGDDRVAYPDLAALSSWSVADELGLVPQLWEERTHNGRTNVASVLERRAAGRLVIEASVGTGTPTHVSNGVLKLLLAVVAVLTLTALLRSVRRRRHDGALVRLSSRTVLRGTLVGGVLLALGGQPAFHDVNGRNGWVNYPTHTYGAVLSILGVAALVLWLTRLYAEGRRRPVIVLVLVLLAVVTNFRYELVFPAGPLALVALLLVPVTPASRAAEGRRAKWVTGTAYVGVFMAVLVALRIYLHELCEPDPAACSPGRTIHLSWDIAGALGRNVAASVPGTAPSRVADFVASRGLTTEGMYTPTPWSVLVGVGMAVALLAGWWATRPAATPGEGPAEPPVDDDVARGSDESRLLVTAAVLCLLGALAAAGVMSLSATFQGSPELGLPYRHSVLTWAGLAWALGLGVMALGQRAARAEVATWVALSLVVGVAAAVLLPAHERSLAADRVANRATVSAFAALVAGDLGEEANADRCRLVPAVEAERTHAARAFDLAFRRHWGHQFCRPPAETG